MILYFSGDGYGWGQPECVLLDQANIMMSYINVRGKNMDPRFRAILKAREKGRTIRVKIKGQEEEENANGNG